MSAQSRISRLLDRARRRREAESIPCPTCRAWALEHINKEAGQETFNGGAA